MLVANNFLDWETAICRRAEILRYGGYLPDIDFNRILDLALWQAGMHRRDIYVTQVLHLLPRERSGGGRHRTLLRRSFASVTQMELRDRRVIALGAPAQEWCDWWLDNHSGAYEVSARLRHPSEPGAPSTQRQANELAEALVSATDRRSRERRGYEREPASVWQVRAAPRRDWPERPDRRRGAS